MARLTFWGDFKANSVEHLNLSGELQLLLNGSDINVVNFEAPVRSKGKAIRKSGPNIKQSIDAPGWIEERGFNLVSLANNHMFDYGEKGFETTQNSFKKAKTIGAGNWEEAFQIQKFTTNDGLTIGILAGTHCEFGTLVDKHTDDEGCAWCQHPMFEKLIRDKKDVDFLIVYNHAGVEYMDAPLPEWREVYKKWIDLGADAVIASHPHVPQGWEYYNDKLIMYSLGNFCFQKDQIVHDYWCQSLCCIMDVKDSSNVAIQIKPIAYDPKSQYLYEDESETTKSHLDYLKQLISDEKNYYEYVNTTVMKLYPSYQGLFTRSGWLNNVASKSFLKGVYERFKKEHAYNCINCESHRWAITRAMRLKYKI